MTSAQAVRRRPDFLGIGVQRSGSTALDSVLRAVPGIWMPPIERALQVTG
jgi:hypothetical protein